jgi:hypothetical protein
MITSGGGFILVYSFLGFLSAASVVIVMYRLGIERFLGYPAILDATVCLLLTWMLHGTLSGMISAIIGSLLFSGMITILRRIHGYEKLEFVGWRLRWVHYDAPVHGLWVRLWQTIKRYA